MRPVHPTRLAILLAIALSTPAAANDSGEIWITAQNTSELKILSGNGHIETISLPAAAQPHTITFSPDGSYAYVSNLGDGNLLVVRTEDRQIVTTINLGPNWTHHTQPSSDGSILLSANPMTGMLTKIAANEETETWTPVAAMNMKTETGTGLGPVCAAFRPDGQRAYVSLFGPGIAVVDVPTMTVIRTIPLIGGIACGLVNSKDGRTIYVISAGGTGHFYRLDMTTDTLTEDISYGPIASGIHGLIVSANEKRAYVTAPGSEQVKVLNLNGSDVGTISLDFTPGVLDAPDSFARKGSYHEMVLIANDLDFSAILAAGAVHGPSVVQLRTQDLLPEAAARIVARALEAHREDIGRGALLSIDEGGARVRMLPLKDARNPS